MSVQGSATAKFGAKPYRIQLSQTRELELARRPLALGSGFGDALSPVEPNDAAGSSIMGTKMISRCSSGVQ
jgi:hypothetical protein